MNNTTININYNLLYHLVLIEDYKNRIITFLYPKDCQCEKDTVLKDIEKVKYDIITNNNLIFSTDFFNSFKIYIYQIIDIHDKTEIISKLLTKTDINKKLNISKFQEIPYYNFSGSSIQLKDIKHLDCILKEEYLFENEDNKKLKTNIQNFKKLINKCMSKPNFLKDKNVVIEINKTVNELIKEIKF